MFSNIIAGAAGFPVADLGDEISQSLRFTGTQYLSRSGLTANQSTTFSMWFKFGKIGIDSIPLSHSGGGGVNQLVFNANGTITGDGTTTQHAISSSVHRDSSAWYHLVYTRGTSNTRLFINGTETPYGTNTVGSGTAVTSPSLPFTIGTVNNASSLFFDGHIADVYFIDGQQLLPTDFGRYQEDGVWVPSNYTGTYGTNGFHLTFDSSQSPNGIGHDSSGNGNHFTANGFNTGDIVSYNDYVYGDASTTYSSTNTNTVWIGSSFGPSAMFDGDLLHNSCKSGTGSAHTWVYWRPNPPISISSSLVVHCSNTQDIRINGTSTGQTNDGTASNFPITIANPPSTLTEIAVQGNSISSGTIYGVVIDGTTIVNNFDTDVDYLDTPTSNYATLNPLSTAAGTPSKGNLAVTSGAVASTPNVPSTIRNITSGDWYFEFEANNGNLTFGIATGDTTYPLGDPRQLGASGTDSIWFGANYIWSGRSGSHTFTPGVTFSEPWINGIRINIDAGEITFYGYGTSLGTFTFAQINTNFQVDFANKPLSFFINPIYSTTKVNWGQKPFLYRPAGFTNSGNLQLNNLLEPTIKDGSDHFQAITGPGSGVSSGTSGAGNYTPYLISGDPNGFGSSYPAVNAFDGSTSTYASPNDWTKSLSFIPATPIPYSSSLRIKCCKYADQTMKLNGVELSAGQLLGCAWSVDITGSGTLESFELGESTAGGAFLYAIEIDGVILTNLSILALAQQAFPKGLWWIKDRDNSSTEHQLVDSVRGTTATIKKSPGLANTAAYSAPSGNSIAWCWNAPDEMDQATRESGNINVTAGRVNQKAGFSILEFTGNATNGQTVAHGLTQEPEFMIAIAQGNTNSIPCWHGHASGAPNAATGLLNGTTAFTLTHVAAVNNQFITIQGNTAINDTGTMSMYLWHSVPGYSAFGKYSGNQSTDGPFIYTGFAPRFLLLKGANLNSDWILLDSTRSTSNPRNTVLYPNYNLNESIVSTLDVDFLSNGFKLRTNNATLNQGYDYLYACFAENPFGGENAAPATAR